MQKRIFISSTQTDLAEYRDALFTAIRKMGHLPVCMEDFGARDSHPVEECERIVRDGTDIFVGIYAHKYGFVPEDSSVSICELEFRAATEAAKPRFIFLLSDEQPWLPSAIDKGKKQRKLNEFKSRLKKLCIVETFTTPDDLCTRAAVTLARHINMESIPAIAPRAVTTAAPAAGLPAESPDYWNDKRNAVYDKRRNLFIARVLTPTDHPGYDFNAFIYLIRHKSDDLSDIEKAEFFLGPGWDNKVFPAHFREGFIGINTLIHGTFLCICRVTFKDGEQVFLERYIEFESRKTGGQST